MSPIHAPMAIKHATAGHQVIAHAIKLNANSTTTHHAACRHTFRKTPRGTLTQILNINIDIKSDKGMRGRVYVLFLFFYLPAYQSCGSRSDKKDEPRTTIQYFSIIKHKTEDSTRARTHAQTITHTHRHDTRQLD